eukprot:COSAG02_NODE_6107_length_3792_cov_139.239784_2_plen_767_part_00
MHMRPKRRKSLGGKPRRYPLAHTLARKYHGYSGEAEPMTRLAPPPGAAALREGPSVEFAVRRFYANDGTAGGVDIKLLQRRPACSESSRGRDGAHDHPTAPPADEAAAPDPFWTTVESERLGLSGRPTVVRILFERPESPTGGDQHDDHSMEAGSSASSGSEDEDEQPHTPRATDGLHVELTGHVTTIRVYLSVHAPYAVEKDAQAKARGAKGVALCRLRLTHTSSRCGAAPSPVSRDVAIGTVNTATIFNTPTSVPSMCGRTSTFFPLLDLPNNLLDAVLAHKTLSDMDIWGEHGITMACRSLYDFVSREEFFICRYCSIWPWALGISRMPDGLPCHLLPLLQGPDDHDSGGGASDPAADQATIVPHNAPGASAVAAAAAATAPPGHHGSLMCAERPMRSAYLHARSRDVAAGREKFPVIALGWQIEDRNYDHPHYSSYNSEEEYAWADEGMYVWTPCAVETRDSRQQQQQRHHHSRDQRLALPIAFRYTQADRRLRPAYLAHAAVNKIAAQRLAALATANETPPLLHLAHHIVLPSDRALIGRMNPPSYFGGSSYRHVHPNTRTPIVISPYYTEEMAASDIGQPRGWGVVIDVSVPIHTVIGEYIGVIHDGSPGSDDDDDDDEEDNDENSPGSGSACMTAAHRYQRQLSDARRRQLNKTRKHMYKLQLHNFMATGHGSIRPHKQGNWTRFINHSSQSPNCRYESQMATQLHSLCSWLMPYVRRYEEWSLPTGVSSQPFIPRVAVRLALPCCQYNAHRLHTDMLS